MVSNLQTSYPFVIVIAMASPELGCRSLAGTSSGTPPISNSESPVMGPNTPKLVQRKRISLEHSITKIGSRSFLIQKSIWDDKSTSQSLAAVWLSQPTPVEMIFLDDIYPQIPQIDNNPAPMHWNFVPTLANFSFQPTSTFVDASEVFANPQSAARLPKCAAGEMRALAYIPRPGGIVRTVPSENEGLVQKRLTEKALTTANLVCVNFEGRKPAP